MKEDKIIKLIETGKNNILLKKYKTGSLFLEYNISWIDNLPYYYIKFIDNGNNIILYNKKACFKNNIELYYVYSYYSIYDNKNGILNNNYIKKIIDILESYNKKIRKEEKKEEV